MPTPKGETQKTHQRPKEVTLWPCFHVEEYSVKPRRGDFVLCKRCDDYREVVPQPEMLGPIEDEIQPRKRGRKRLDDDPYL
jgi:hypothetical protein